MLTPSAPRASRNFAVIRPEARTFFPCKVVKTGDIRVAEHHLRRIGGDRQDLAVEAGLVDVLDHGAGGIDHHPRLIGGQRQQRHVQSFKLRCIGDGVVGNGHCDIIDPVAQQPEDVGNAEVHLVVRCQFDRDRAVRGCRQGFGPERQLVLLVQGQAGPASDNRQGFRGSGRREKGGRCQKDRESRFHVILL
jgi:hypothetical protein